MKKIKSISDIIDFLNSSDDSNILNLMYNYERQKQVLEKDIYFCICSIVELDHIQKRLGLEGYKFKEIVSEEKLSKEQRIIRDYLVKNLKKLLVEEEKKKEFKKRK